jgi:hypothetical protein
VPSLPTTAVGLALAVWLIVAPAWAPLLSADRVRALFEGPSRSLAVNYAVASFLLVLAHVLVFLGGLVVCGRLDGLAVVRWTVGVAVAVPLLAGAVAAVGLPRLGRWDPTAGGVDGRVMLGLGALWYAMVAGGAVSVLFVLVFAFHVPV